MSHRSSRILEIVALALTLVGLGLGGVLLQRHVAAKVGSDPMLSALCSMDARWNCDEVLSSAYGTFAGLPTALWGFFFFAGLLSWFLVMGRRWRVVPVLLTGLGTAGCAWLAFVMYTRLPARCPLCLATHLTTAALFVVSLLMLRSPRPAVKATGGGTTREREADTAKAQRLREDAAGAGWTVPRWRLVTLCVTLTAASGALGWSEYHRRLAEGFSQEYYTRWREYENDYDRLYAQFMSHPKYDVPIREDDFIRGKKDAVHTVTVISDYQCPHCARLEADLEEVLKLYGDRVRIVFKNFPINQQCNPHAKTTLHAASCVAAQAAEAVGIVGGEEKFWQFHDRLFKQQQAFARNPNGWITTTSTELGLDPQAVLGQIAGAARERVLRDIEDTAPVGIRGTPTVLFNGRKMGNRMSDRYFWRYVVGREPDAPPTSQPAGSATTGSEEAE